MISGNSNLTIRLLRQYLFGPPKFEGISAGLTSRQPCMKVAACDRLRQVPPACPGAAASARDAAPPAVFPFDVPQPTGFTNEPPITLVWSAAEREAKFLGLDRPASDAVGRTIDVTI